MVSVMDAARMMATTGCVSGPAAAPLNC